MKTILIICLLAISFSSCLGTKRIIDKDTEKQTHTSISKKSDSSATIEKNREIQDEFLLSLKTSDSLTNDAIRKALKDFEQTKTSGTNSTSISFDYDKLALRLKNIIGETQDKETTTNNEKSTEKTTEETIKEYAKTLKRVIPWWVYLIAFVLGYPIISKIFKDILSILNPVFGTVIKLVNKK